jgi:hypothetical protein
MIKSNWKPFNKGVWETPRWQPLKREQGKDQRIYLGTQDLPGEPINASNYVHSGLSSPSSSFCLFFLLSFLSALKIYLLIP